MFRFMQLGTEQVPPTAKNCDSDFASESLLFSAKSATTALAKKVQMPIQESYLNDTTAAARKPIFRAGGIPIQAGDQLNSSNQCLESVSFQTFFHSLWQCGKIFYLVLSFFWVKL
jgi:hypothetical protein